MFSKTMATYLRPINVPWKRYIFCGHNWGYQLLELILVYSYHPGTVGSSRCLTDQLNGSTLGTITSVSFKS